MEVVVVCLDLRALVVVAVLDQRLNQMTVLLAEVFHAVALVFQTADLRSKQEPIELLLLVSLSIFLYDDCGAEVLKQLVLEVVEVLCLLISLEVGEDAVALRVCSLEPFKRLSCSADAGSYFIELGKKETGLLVFAVLNCSFESC